jgi:hydrogenase expression/formation protein HypE
VIEERHIILAHGNGGRFMRELIDDIFARHLGGPDLDVTLDAAPISLQEADAHFMSTDAFTVQPLEFPGGDIGSLAVHGTVNDLAVAGATPLYLTLNAIIEEGLEIACLDRVIASLAAAAGNAGVKVVAGDTKVVPRGHGGGLYLATTGIGIKRAADNLGMQLIQPGDVIVVSGPVGDHGISVMLAREDFDIQGEVRSDCASVLPLTEAAVDLDGLRFMRDPTRGGLATVMHEIAAVTGVELRISESAIPVRDPVRMVCEMLGYDPLYLACEGRVVAVVAEQDAEKLLARWRQLPDSEEAAIIGVVNKGAARVVLNTEIGGERILEELEDDPLPRIC